MPYNFKLSFYKSDVVGAEADPNISPPIAARIITAPGETQEVHTALLYVSDGTSLVVTVWFHDATSGTWLTLGSSLTVIPGIPSEIEVPPGAQLFTQLGVNTGGVTKFGVGFVSGETLQTSGSQRTQTVDGSGANAFPARVGRTVHLASAALPAASAYTSQTAYAVPDHQKSVSFFVTYTRGAAGGYARFRLLWGNGTEEARELAIDPSAAVSQPNAQQPAYLSEVNGPVPADGTAIVFLVEAVVPGGVTTARLLAAEFGVAGTPGTCAIALTAGGA